MVATNFNFSYEEPLILTAEYKDDDGEVPNQALFGSLAPAERTIDIGREAIADPKRSLQSVARRTNYDYKRKSKSGLARGAHDPQRT